MKIVVDADACPKTVLRICHRLGSKHRIPVWSVASFDHHIESDYHICVGNSSQEADMKIINMTEAGDVVVTQDWGLAAMVLGRGAKCLSPGGWEFRRDRIEFLLEEREVKSKFRRRGGRTRGPRKRASHDDRRFESFLEKSLTPSATGVKR